MTNNQLQQQLHFEDEMWTMIVVAGQPFPGNAIQSWGTKTVEFGERYQGTNYARVYFDKKFTDYICNMTAPNVAQVNYITMATQI